MALTLLMLFAAAVADYDNNSRVLALELYRANWIDAGVLSPDEKWRFFIYTNCIEDDEVEMVRRLNMMQTDCPPESDIYKFPPTDFCRYNWSLARRYRERLEELAAFMHPVLQSAMYPQYLDQCRREKFWDVAADAVVGYGGDGRRLSLQFIRDFVGRDDYAAGKWPYPLIEFGQTLEWKLP